MEEDRVRAVLEGGRPYFGTALAARQGDPRRKGYMRPLVKRVASQLPGSPINILEIGSWAGASAVAWARALEEEGLPGTVVCVDHWNRYLDTTVNTEPIYQQMTAAVENDAIYRLFRHNVRVAGVGGRVVEMRGSSQTILPQLASESFQIAYIDASHLYNDVLSDIVNSSRLICDRGILCGDDLELQQHECDHDVAARACRDGRDYIQDPRTGTFFHPGVTRAVAERFGPVTVQEGVWAVQRAGTDWTAGAPIDGAITIPGHLTGSEEEPSPPRFARVNRSGVLVSVVVNYFERETAIYPVIERLLNQRLSCCSANEIEVIVVNDGSEPGTLPERLPELVTYVWQRKDRYGIARAKNLGAKIANGRYIVFLDADILVAETYLDAVVQAFERWDERVVHCGYIRDYHGHGTPDPRTEFGVWENPGMPTGRFLQVAGGNLAIARSLFLESGGFDEDLVYGGVEDLLFGYQLGQLPRTAIRFDPRMASSHLPHPPSTAHANVAASWNVVRIKYPAFYENYIVRGLR